MPTAAVGIDLCRRLGGLCRRSSAVGIDRESGSAAPWDPVLLTALHVAPTPNNYTGGANWYMDTGATAHMSAHPGNLASFTPVLTDRRIIVGDGSTLPITHIGHASFPSTSRPLSLSNILVSPDLIKNLVSVKRFTRENPVTVEFDDIGFCVKDARTKMVLHR